MAGYHIKDIPRGEIGHFSKVNEEFLEFCDALEQKSHIMALIELSDLVGSIKIYLINNGYSKEWDHVISVDDSPAVDANEVKKVFSLLNNNISLNDYKYFFNTLNCYLKNYYLGLNDLVIMANITERVFINGYRSS